MRVDSAERLERARERAADRLHAIIGSDDWATFDHERIALVFSGFDLTGPDIVEAAADIGEPYSTLLVEAAVETWREAMQVDPDESGRAAIIGARFGAAAGQTVQGVLMVGILIGLMAADEKATPED